MKETREKLQHESVLIKNSVVLKTKWMPSRSTQSNTHYRINVIENVVNDFFNPVIIIIVIIK